MRKLAVILIAVAALLFGLGCTYTLADKTQQENLAQLNESWEYMNELMSGQQDDPSTEDDESREPQIPGEILRDSFTDLLRESSELEMAKGQTWQERAKAEGWESATSEEDDDD